MEKQEAIIIFLENFVKVHGFVFFIGLVFMAISRAFDKKGKQLVARIFDHIGYDVSFIGLSFSIVAALLLMIFRTAITI